jgi:hypothetical protein
MHTLEPELRTLHAAGALDDDTASRAVALDRREVFSVHGELRALLYGGVLLVTTGVGVLLARRLDQVGPLAIVLAVAAVAAACYWIAARGRVAGRELGVASDYVLLLGALLASADLAYAERQFGLLGPLWSRHLLLLAALHAVTAYAYRSPLLLAAALAALAGWFGIGTPFDGGGPFDRSAPQIGTSALVCAALIYAWREADRRLRPSTTFGAVFDQFAANLAFWGALAWCSEFPWLYAGLLLVAALAAIVIREGLRRGREPFVVYGVVYAALALCIVIVPRLPGFTVTMGFVLVVVAAAATVLWQLLRARGGRDA